MKDNLSKILENLAKDFNSQDMGLLCNTISDAEACRDVNCKDCPFHSSANMKRVVKVLNL